MKLISRNHLRQMLGARETPVMIVASKYFRQRYPKASDADISVARAVLLDCTTGESFKHDCCPSPLYDYVRTVIVGMLGGDVVDGVAWLPPNLADIAFSSHPPEPSAEQSAFVFNLIETLIFRTRGERAKAFRSDWIENGIGGGTDDPKLLLAEAIALLEATKGAFKSSLVAEAKEKLRRLEVLIGSKSQ